MCLDFYRSSDFKRVISPGSNEYNVYREMRLVFKVTGVIYWIKVGRLIVLHSDDINQGYAPMIHLSAIPCTVETEKITTFRCCTNILNYKSKTLRGFLILFVSNHEYCEGYLLHTQFMICRFSQFPFQDHIVCCVLFYDPIKCGSFLVKSVVGSYLLTTK